MRSVRIKTKLDGQRTDPEKAGRHIADKIVSAGFVICFRRQGLAVDIGGQCHWTEFFDLCFGKIETQQQTGSLLCIGWRRESERKIRSGPAPLAAVSATLHPVESAEQLVGGCQIARSNHTG